MRIVITMIFFVGVGFVIGQFVRVKTIVTPQDPEVLYTEAYRHYEASADKVHRSSVDNSINFCRLALDLDPDYENAYRLLGNIHMKRENYIEALACWKKLQDIPWGENHAKFIIWYMKRTIIDFENITKACAVASK